MTSSPPPATRTRPLVCTAAEVRELLTAGAMEIRRRVKAPTIQARDGGKAVGPMLVDLSRAWVDPGFPLGDDDTALPMERWGKGADPAPDSAYRYQYLHAPIAHPSDGWSADPRDDRWMRLYCPIGRPGDLLRVKEAWRPWYSCDCGQALAGAHYAADDRKIRIAEADSHDDPKVYPIFAMVMDRAHRGISGEMIAASHMPRWAARLTLSLVSVRIERAGERWEWVAVVRRVEDETR